MSAIPVVYLGGSCVEVPLEVVGGDARVRPRHSWLDPDSLFLVLVRAACRRGYVSPSILPSSRIGFGSLCGNVREENEDYALGFSFGNLEVVVVADGLGGLPLGRIASFLAVRAACWWLIANQNTRFSMNQRVRGAIEAASDSLACYANRLSVSADGGLRSTLIVGIGSRGRWTVGWIGDGGAWLSRRDGSVLPLLVPHRVDPAIPNLVAASLGPEMDGNPEVAQARRRKGDVLVIGSDGIADRTSPELFSEVVRDLVCEGVGDLNGRVDALLGKLADLQDEFGFICDDNISLGLVADSKVSSCSTIVGGAR